MILSKLIKELEDKRAKYGDVEVYVQNLNEEEDLVLDKDFYVTGGVCKEENFVVID